MDSDFPILQELRQKKTVRRVGKVAEAFGTILKVTGIDARIGDICDLVDPDSQQTLKAEVVGIQGRYLMLAPMGVLEGVSTRMQVHPSNHGNWIGVDERMLGRVVDAYGNPLDGELPLEGLHQVPVYRESPDPLNRLPVSEPLETGVKALDSLLTTGLGQRVGIFAVAGGGKSTLLGMLARGAASDINVIVLVGERGREVREFMEDSLGDEGLRRSIVVVATSDRPALERARAACVGMALAEYFRDQGKKVMLMMDSVTRYARALRDVGLSLGEPPVRRGFPPSVFSMLPRLFERAGNNDKGYITAFYTVLQEEEQEGEDPIAEEVRSLLDGHIILSRKLAAAAHYPAIDVMTSASRVFEKVTSPQHRDSARQMRKLIAKYQELEWLIQLGEYKAGADPEADEAIAKKNPIRDLLQQSAHTCHPFEETVKQMVEIVQ
ncbi:flagellum-specific ATP synthase FliI [Hahella sp. CCB-MM4]|uniref:FliI/YscN family ATPase n=1 Tax=Hahella sp. (strain CCB-MM4) TaxID=1926491 RepID=UPI000B9B931B|nr:FliI/YscN family ATPase [Hahella sp. CCB-MM4]OZG74391.1 flagellum-specific ATP synthase FliI [Hahella sp. CCB-MM4]